MKAKLVAQSFSRVRLFATPWTVAYQALSSHLESTLIWPVENFFFCFFFFFIFLKRVEGVEVLSQPALLEEFKTVSCFIDSFKQFPCLASVIAHSPDLHPPSGPYLYPFLAPHHPPDSEVKFF